MKLFYVVVQAVLLLCLPVVVVGAPDLKLVMVQVLHRHGARSAEPSYNKTQICTESPCGYLSWAGVEMLNKTGSFLRSRYNEDTSVVSEPMFPSLDYDLDIAYSRSTDVLRTLQSAESFLRGFFPNLTSLYPAIHTMPEKDDFLLYTNYAPQYQFFYNLDKPSVRGVCNPITDKNFPNFGTLAEIGKEVYSEGYCSNYDTRSDCARKLFDIAVAKDAVGELDKYPLLKANKDALGQSARALFANQYAYNRSNVRSLQQGSAAQSVLQQFVANINMAVNAVLTNTKTYKLFHYSAHDTTLSRIAASLQDTTDDGLLPPFSQALVLELLENETDKTFYVRVLRGHTGQSPDTGFEFAWESDWQLKCMNAWQVAYNATGNTCPIADFARFVQWSAPPSTSKGYCYLDAKYQALMNCPTGGIQSGEAYQTLSSGCQYYRNRCPAYACEPGYMLNSVSLQCVCVSASCSSVGTGATTGTRGSAVRITDEDQSETALLQSSGMSGAAVASVALGSLCVGVLVAAFITSAVCLCRRPPRYVKLEQA